MAAEINDRFNAMVGRLHVKERYEALTEYAHNNPLKAIFIGVVVATSLFPTLLFLGFLTISLLFGLAVLVFIEGIALAIAGVSLLFVLAGCLATSITFTAFLVSSLLTLRFARSILMVFCERFDKYASKWEGIDGPIGRMIKSCRALTGRVCRVCDHTENKNRKSPEVSEIPEKKY